jgi:hypothetical protein
MDQRRQRDRVRGQRLLVGATEARDTAPAALLLRLVGLLVAEEAFGALPIDPLYSSMIDSKRSVIVGEQ